MEALVGPAPVERHSGPEANEDELTRALRERALVHIATHGVLNARNPLFSRLEMTPGPVGDGRLEVHEVLELDVHARLVFISGCETALGPAGSTTFERGEDYATLAEAFLRSGARHVVATLWRIEDEGAAAFAERFFSRLDASSGSDPVRALAEAQRHALADSRFAAPYYWAGYQVAGWGG